jgi:hypothetical protein
MPSGTPRKAMQPAAKAPVTQSGGLDERAEARLVVAHHDVGDEGGHQEDREDGHHELRLRDRVGRVDEHVAAAADLDVVGGDGTEAQQEEHDGRQPERGRLELVAQLERGDGAEHGGAPQAALRREAASVAK